MINVIILTKNKNIAILDVPLNGRLYIKESHLIVSIVNSGVKMIPSPNTTPLIPIETYLQNECMEVSMLSPNLFHPEGRLLDFTSIELLVSQYLTNISNIGSTEDFIAPVYQSGGYPVNYNLRIKGMDFSDTNEADLFIKSRFGQNAICNALSFDGNNYQRLSLINTTANTHSGWKQTPLKEIYDIGVGMTKADDYLFDFCPNLEVVDMPNAVSWSQFAIFNAPYSKNLRLINTPKCTLWGSTPAASGILHNKVKLGINVFVSRVMETSNAGAPDAGITALKSNDPTAVINYVD